MSDRQETKDCQGTSLARFALEPWTRGGQSLDLQTYCRVENGRDEVYSGRGCSWGRAGSLRVWVGQHQAGKGGRVCHLDTNEQDLAWPTQRTKTRQLGTKGRMLRPAGRERLEVEDQRNHVPGMRNGTSKTLPGWASTREKPSEKDQGVGQGHLHRRQRNKVKE